MEGKTRPATAELTVFTPHVSPERHELPSGVVSIGRSEECTIPVRDRYLSRLHAEIRTDDDGRWFLRDRRSANGTYVNGDLVESEVPLQSGDRIRVGDTEIVFHVNDSTDRVFAVADTPASATIAIPIRELEPTTAPQVIREGESTERLRILSSIGAELIEDQPLHELFGFVIDRVMDHLKPTRAAIGLLADTGTSFASVEIRRLDPEDASELVISRTLLAELVEEKKALAFMDVSADEKLSQAHSIVLQGIHSVLCAPMLIADCVVGVLYVDYLFNQRSISEEDVRLVAQIAQVAAMKLETTRLREEAIQKRLIDEELKTAYAVQRGLLPETPPLVAGYTFEGRNHPLRSVSGDYYDFVPRPDGRIYFVIADVAGKGVTAALIMAGLQAAFRIFTKGDPTTAELVSQLNSSLRETIPRSKFVTLFAGILDPQTGEVEYTNAGHMPPIWIKTDHSTELSDADLILGLKTHVGYTSRKITLERGDSLLLFTDGITEALDTTGKELGYDPIHAIRASLFDRPAPAIADRVEGLVRDFVAAQSLSDDITLVVISRSSGDSVSSESDGDSTIIHS